MFSVIIDRKQEEVTYPLSLEDILEDENGGVYEPKGFRNTYVVVFPGNDYNNVLYIDEYGGLEELDYECWADNEFRRTNLNVELRLT